MKYIHQPNNTIMLIVNGILNRQKNEIDLFVLIMEHMPRYFAK